MAPQPRCVTVCLPMKLSLDDTSATYTIRAYETGRVIINEHTLTHSVIVLPEQLIPDWPPQSVEQLTAEHVDQLVALEPAIILLGTGAHIRFPHPRLTHGALRRGIGFEVMDTAAACRTYNIIAAEGRRVAAALMMI